MQQLSLFDFGDETPKQEKKKQPSQKDASPSKQAGTSDVSEKDEIQHPDTDSVPTVPDQITNEDSPNPENDHALETAQQAGTEADLEQEPAVQEGAEANNPPEENEEKESDEIPMQEASTPAPESNPEISGTESEDHLTHPEGNIAESNTNDTDTSTKPDSVPEKASEPISEAESGSETGSEALQASPIINKDIVFSDESIIVKFKPKGNSSTLQATEAPIETTSQDNLPTENKARETEKENPMQKNNGEPENNGSTAPIKVEADEIDTSFPPLSEQEAVDEPASKVAHESIENMSSAPDAQPNEEAENPDGQTAISQADAENQETAGHLAGNPPQKEDQTTPVEASQPSTGEEPNVEAEGTPNDGSHAESDSEVSTDENPEENVEVPLDSEIEKGIDQEHNSPTPPHKIYDTTKAGTEPLVEDSEASIDFNLAEEEGNESVNEQVQEKKVSPAISHKRGRKSFKEIDAEVDLIDVPSDEELFKKQYYPISVVAKWFRVNNSLLRFWENEFKILKPKKNKKGDRFFRPEDIKNLQIIYYLLRQKKLTINGAIKHLKSKKEHTEVNLQIIQSLNEFKGFLLELRATTEK